MTENTESTAAPKTRRSHRTSSAAQARALVQGLVNLVLVIMTVRDIRKRSDDEINGSRKRWLLAAFAPPLGPLAYLVFGRKHSPQTVVDQSEPIAQPAGN